MSGADKTKLDGLTLIKTMYFTPAGNSVQVTASYAAIRVSSNGTINFSFVFPPDFVSIVSLIAVCIPASTVPAANIDITSNYAAIGELHTANTETDTTATYALVADTFFGVDLAPVFTGAVAGDQAGILLDHTGTGNVDYIAVELVYSTG
jgi:hypothetical protein